MLVVSGRTLICKTRPNGSKNSPEISNGIFPTHTSAWSRRSCMIASANAFSAAPKRYAPMKLWHLGTLPFVIYLRMRNGKGLNIPSISPSLETTTFNRQQEKLWVSLMSKRSSLAFTIMFSPTLIPKRISRWTTTRQLFRSIRVSILTSRTTQILLLCWQLSILLSSTNFYRLMVSSHDTDNRSSLDANLSSFKDRPLINNWLYRIFNHSRLVSILRLSQRHIQ